MSYYNFNDHFWSPKKVCSQTTQAKSKETIANKRRILAMLSLAFIAVGTSLVIPKLVPARNEAQREISLKKNLGNRCILVGRNPDFSQNFRKEGSKTAKMYTAKQSQQFKA